MSQKSTSTNVRAVRRRWLLWCVLVLVAVGLLVYRVGWPRGDALEINRVPFRLWVAQHPDFAIQDPLAAVGPKAIPHLIRILREPRESPRAFHVKAWVWKHLPQSLQSRFYRWHPVPRWQLKRTALFGLRFLGPEAKEAIPEVLRVGLSETNTMVRASALTAALQIAPESPGTFDFWREEWERTNHFSRHDLAVYLHSARHPVPPAVPLLLKELKQNPGSVQVIEAFEFFGDQAQPAVPYMIKMLGGIYRGNMMNLLRRLGPVGSEASSVLAGLLDSDDPDIVAGSLEALKSIGSRARAALPGIQPLMTNSDPTIRMLAASAFAHIEGDLERAVPVLLDGLEGGLLGATKTFIHVNIRQDMPGLVTSGSEAATILLGELGPPAQSALPALERQLAKSAQSKRLAAAQAAWRISHEKEKALPVLIAILNAQLRPSAIQPLSDEYTIIRAIEAIEEMGREAEDAVPALERVRPFSMRVRRAVNEALPRIIPH